MAINKQLIAEAFKEAARRKAGQPESFAGLPGGAPAANQRSPQNPLTTVPPGNPGRPPIGSAPQPQQDQTQEARSRLQQARPGEAEIIVKALINRLKNLNQ